MPSIDFRSNFVAIFFPFPFIHSFWVPGWSNTTPISPILRCFICINVLWYAFSTINIPPEYMCVCVCECAHRNSWTFNRFAILLISKDWTIKVFTSKFMASNYHQIRFMCMYVCMYMCAYSHSLVFFVLWLRSYYTSHRHIQYSIHKYTYTSISISISICLFLLPSARCRTEHIKF